MKFELIRNKNKIYVCPSLEFEVDSELNSIINKRNKIKIALNDKKYIRIAVSFLIAINFLLRLIVLLSSEIIGMKILFTIVSIMLNVFLIGFIIFKLNFKIKTLEDEYNEIDGDFNNRIELFLQNKIKNINTV